MPVILSSDIGDKSTGLSQLQITARPDLPPKGTPEIFVPFAWGDDSSQEARKRTEVGQKFGNIAGLAFIILGTAMVGIAAARFVITAKNIAREDLRPETGSRIDIALRGCWSFWAALYSF